MEQNNLANRLLYLPLDIHEKILLWLTYKGQKPVSEIAAHKRDKKYLCLRRLNPELAKKYPQEKYDYNSRNSLRIRKWLSDAGLVLITESPQDITWFISHDLEKAKAAMQSLHRFDRDNQIKTGLLFGFPRDSVIAYADCLSKTQDEIGKIMVGTGDLVLKNEYLKDKYFTPYIFYNISREKIKKDSQIAQKWADVIRKDVPKLAQWFEKSQSHRH